MTKLFFFLLIFLFPLITAPVRAAVVINELFPKTVDTANAWIELYNTGSEAVSLDRWKLQSSTHQSILNAGAIIQPHGFLTFTGSQTNITFSVEGDTVRLSDAGNTQMDSQQYPGTLGYNTAMGRSVDGAGVWAACTTATFNTNNACPQPSPTATPTPTPTNTHTPTIKPTSTSFPTITEIPTTTITIQVTPTLIPTVTPSPTPITDNGELKISKVTVAYILLGIAAAALSLILTLWLRKKRVGN